MGCHHRSLQEHCREVDVVEMDNYSSSHVDVAEIDNYSSSQVDCRWNMDLCLLLNHNLRILLPSAFPISE